LAELVKIDPKSLGVGMYQHDMKAKELGKAVDATVEVRLFFLTVSCEASLQSVFVDSNRYLFFQWCVNLVGADLNTASVPLLSRISGLTESRAKAIVERRSTKGRFCSREELMEVLLVPFYLWLV
jgi:uncharacterized protein